MELAIDDPIKRAQLMAGQVTGGQTQNSAPLSSNPSLGQEMGSMVKKRAMNTALNKGQEGLVKAFTPAATTTTPVVGSAIEGGAVLGSAAPAVTGGAAGAGAMTALGTAMPYVGAGILAGKALGFFNEGGQVGPLSTQYAAGGMSAEDYRYQMPGGDVYNARMERNKVKQAQRESMPIMTMPDGSVNQQYYNMQEAKRQLQKQQDFVYPQIIPDNGKLMGAQRMAYTDDPIAQRMYGVGNAPIDTSLMPLGFIGHPTDNQGYTARGYDQGGEVMSEEQARALMNNQPEPMRENPYDRLLAQSMAEGAIGTPESMGRPRPVRQPLAIGVPRPVRQSPMPAPLSRPVDPLEEYRLEGRDRTYNPYDMIRPDNAPNT